MELQLCMLEFSPVQRASATWLQLRRHIQNPDIARVLEKIRRFHAVVKANGGTTVDLVQMAAGNAEISAVSIHS